MCLAPERMTKLRKHLEAPALLHASRQVVAAGQCILHDHTTIAVRAISAEACTKQMSGCVQTARSATEVLSHGTLTQGSFSLSGVQL